MKLERIYWAKGRFFVPFVILNVAQSTSLSEPSLSEPSMSPMRDGKRRLRYPSQRFGHMHTRCSKEERKGKGSCVLSSSQIPFFLAMILHTPSFGISEIVSVVSSVYLVLMTSFLSLPLPQA